MNIWNHTNTIYHISHVRPHHLSFESEKLGTRRARPGVLCLGGDFEGSIPSSVHTPELTHHESTVEQENKKGHRRIHGEV